MYCVADTPVIANDKPYPELSPNSSGADRVTASVVGLTVPTIVKKQKSISKDNYFSDNAGERNYLTESSKCGNVPACVVCHSKSGVR